MVDVSIPAGTLGLLLDPITKFLFLDSYRVSHEEHLKHTRLGKRFGELGSFFEFDIHLECNYLSNSTVPMSFIILRNKSENKFSRAELLVEADAGHVKYQDFTTLIDLDSIPRVVSLPSIPLKEVEFTDSNDIVTSYNNVRVKIKIIDDKIISEEESSAESCAISPTYTEFLNSNWDKKWGVVWNLDYIERCKTILKSKLEYYFITRNSWPVVGEPDSTFYQVYKLARLLFGIPLFKFLSNKYVLLTLFWVPIFMRLKKLTPRRQG